MIAHLLRSAAAAALLLCATAALAQTPVGDTCTRSDTVISTSCTTSRTETVVDTAVRTTVQTYSTRLLAVLDGVATVYDQTFAVAFADASVQAAVTAAQSALLAAGAPDPVVLGGPVQTDLSTLLVSSITAPPVVTSIVSALDSATTWTSLGPGPRLNGDLGLCTGSGPEYPVVGGGYGAPTNCTGGSFELGTVSAGGTDIRINLNTLTTISRTIATTDTFLTTALYTLTGTTQRSTSVPEPGTPALALLAVPALALARRRAIGRSSDPRFAG